MAFSHTECLAERYVMEKLPAVGIDFLVGLCEEFRIDVAEEKKVNKNYLLKMVFRHLTSDQIENLADHGLQIFEKLQRELHEELDKGVPKSEEEIPGLSDIPELTGLEGTPKPDVKDPSYSVNQAVIGTPKTVTNHSLTYHKLRQFKVNGSIGDPGQKGCLSYSSLCFEIRRGEREGYQLNEIYAGIIRAIEAGNPFRDVLELEAEVFDRNALMTSLRSHFEERDPNSIFNELRMCRQGPKESAHKFCCRAVALKKKVESMSQIEGIPVDADNLRTTFFKAMYTGLRQNNIRNELRQILKEARISDQDLLMEVSLASANEKERLGKFNEEKVVAKVNKLTCVSDSEESNNESASASSSAVSPPDRQNKRVKAKAKSKDNNSNQASIQNNSSSIQGNVQSDQLFAEVSKISSAVQQLSTSNAKLTAEINVLKGQLTKNHKPQPLSPAINNNTNGVSGFSFGAANVGNNPSAFPLANNSNLNPTRSSFQPRQFSATGRPIYKCDSCTRQNIPYCNHCFKCGDPSHKVNVCPVN